MSNRAALRILLPTALAVLALCPGAQQVGGGGGVSAPPAPGGGLAGLGLQSTPSTPFTWAETLSALGQVKIPIGPAGGFSILGPGIQFRFVPGHTQDITIEVLLWPPHSGHPTNPERFLAQVPLQFWKQPQKERALVLAFHPFGVSEKSPFNGTTLPQLCADRGWILLAPYGLVDTNFANEASQLALEAVLAFFRRYITWNEERVYTVGFSMGGMNAVSFAMRHLSKRPRVAGVICHTGTMDVVYEYDTGTSSLQQLLEDPQHFNGTPSQVPFSYERVSPFRVLNGAVDPENAPVTNLVHVPFYLHLNLQDPNLHLVQHNVDLRNYILALGGVVKTDAVNAGLQHSWSTLPMDEAVQWIEQFSKEPDPVSAELFADRETSYLYTEVLSADADVHARYRVQVDVVSNSFELTGTRNLNDLALEVVAMGLDPAQLLSFTHQSQDATSDHLFLRDYAAPPSGVLVNGSPSSAWSHDAAKGEVEITPSAFGTFSLVQILP